MRLVCPDCGVVEERHPNCRRCTPCQFVRNRERPTRRLPFEARKAYYQGRKGIVVAQNRERQVERTEYMKAYRVAKAEVLRQKARDRRAADPEFQAKANAGSSEWRAMRLRAMPLWLTADQRAAIARVYVDGKALGMHVDHIIPLRGRAVWGLHVPWNLQLLTQSENCRKSNTV